MPHSSLHVCAPCYAIAPFAAIVWESHTRLTVHAVINDEHYTFPVFVIGTTVPPFTCKSAKLEYNGIVDLSETRHCHGDLGPKFRLYFNNGVRLTGELGTTSLSDASFDLTGYGAWEKHGLIQSTGWKC